MLAVRSTIALVATAVAFGVSFVMLQRVVSPASPWLGLLLMFDFMGLAKIAQPLFMLRIPSALRTVRPWETTGATYGRLGVNGFGKLLRTTPLRHLNASVYLARGRGDLVMVYRYAESAEAIHFWAMVLFAPYVIYIVCQRNFVVAAILILIEILFNLYPILHLRVLRGRLDDLFAKRHAKRALSSRPDDN